MMLIINGLIALFAELGINICALIAIWMINSKLGAITLGLYFIKLIALGLIKKEQNDAMNEIFKKGEKL
jgi:hypothetical protein